MIDDFADDKEIQRTRAERAAFEKMMNECDDILSMRLKVQDSSHKNLKNFLMIRAIDTPFVRWSYQSVKTPWNLHVSIIEYRSKSNLRYAVALPDYYHFGLLTTKKSFPRTVIIPETITEKLADVFTRAELDIKKHRKFSRKFYVLTEDRDKLYNSIAGFPLDELAKFKTLEMELHGNLVLFRISRKPVSPDETKKFCDLAEILHHVFSSQILL